VAELIPDRDVVQIGIGSIPEAVLSVLKEAGKRISVCGMGIDAQVDLAEAGTLKLFPGKSACSVISTELMGTEKLFRFKFKRLIENHIYVVATEATILGIYYEEDKELDEKYLKSVKEARRVYTNKLIALYKQGVTEKVFKDINPTIAVFAVLGAANWVYRWYREGAPLSARKIAALMAELLADGYFAR